MWTVGGFSDELAGKKVDVVEDEAMHLLSDPNLADGAKCLIGWMMAVNTGKATPLREPTIDHEGHTLRYRCEDQVALIFSISESLRLVRVLRFGKTASGYPSTADLSIAVRRLNVKGP